jgi:hypothetical protein
MPQFKYKENAVYEMLPGLAQVWVKRKVNFERDLFVLNERDLSWVFLLAGVTKKYHLLSEHIPYHKPHGLSVMGLP